MKTKKSSKKRTSMRARMARFARVFWKKIQKAAESVKNVAKKVGKRVNSVGNYAPTPDEPSKPSVARRVARVVSAIPKFIAMVAGFAGRIVIGLASTVLSIVALGASAILWLAHGAWQALVLALSTPYYLTYSTEYAKDNWKGLWNEFSFKDARDLIASMFEEAEDLWETDDIVIEAVILEEPILVPDEEQSKDLREQINAAFEGVPEAQQPKGHPTPKQHHPREPYPFGLPDLAVVK